jgi:hypothetical protein
VGEWGSADHGGDRQEGHVTPEELLQLLEVQGPVDLEKYDRPKGRPVEDVSVGEYL